MEVWLHSEGILGMIQGVVGGGGQKSIMGKEEEWMEAE